jgi:hypothetical protein
VNLGGELVNDPGQLGVGVQLQLTGDEVVVGLGLLEGGCRFCPIITKVDKKIASRETMSVRVGQGLLSNTSIHTAKTTPCRYTNLIEPAKAVIASATRSWSLPDLRSATARKAGCMVLLSSVWLIGRFPLVVLSIADAEQSGMKDRGWSRALPTLPLHHTANPG